MPTVMASMPFFLSSGMTERVMNGTSRWLSAMVCVHSTINQTANDSGHRVESEARIEVLRDAERRLEQRGLHVLGLQVERAGVPRDVAALNCRRERRKLQI